MAQEGAGAGLDQRDADPVPGGDGGKTTGGDGDTARVRAGTGEKSQEIGASTSRPLSRELSGGSSRSHAHQTLSRYVKELFTFVADPAVPMTNNPAEQALRSIVVARKISIGSRSPSGTHTRMVLASIAGTATIRDQNPHTTFPHYVSHQE